MFVAMKTSTTSPSPPLSPPQEKMSNNDDEGKLSQSSQSNLEESNEKTEVISNKMADKQNNIMTDQPQEAPQPRCDTCGSTNDCEEDVDNPGDYYCKSCWEEYDETEAGNEEVKPPALNENYKQSGEGTMSLDVNATSNNDGSSCSPATSDFMTPRGLSWGTQPESSQEMMQTQPPLQSQPFSLHSQAFSMASSQPLPASQDQVAQTGVQCSGEGVDPSEANEEFKDAVSNLEGGKEKPAGTGIIAADERDASLKSDNAPKGDNEGKESLTEPDTEDADKDASLKNDHKSDNTADNESTGNSTEKNTNALDQNSRDNTKSSSGEEKNEEVEGLPPRPDGEATAVNKGKGSMSEAGTKEGADKESMGSATEKNASALDEGNSGNAKSVYGEKIEQVGELAAQPDKSKVTIVTGAQENQLDSIRQTHKAEKNSDSVCETKIGDIEMGNNDQTDKQDESSDEEDESTILSQEEIADSKDNDGALGGTFGLLTQCADSDQSDAEDDDSDASTKGAGNVNEAGNNNDGEVSFAKDIIKTLENKASQETPMIEAVTTTAGSQSKAMTLSGLTEPTQSDNTLPREKLPSFSPGKKVVESSEVDAVASPQLPRKELDGLTAGSNSAKKLIDDLADDGSSAYQGLTEEDHETKDAPPAASDQPLHKVAFEEKLCVTASGKIDDGSNHVAADDGSSAYHGLTEDDEIKDALGTDGDQSLSKKPSPTDRDVGHEEPMEEELQPSDSCPNATSDSERKKTDNDSMVMDVSDDGMKPTETNPESGDLSSQKEQELDEKLPTTPTHIDKAQDQGKVQDQGSLEESTVAVADSKQMVAIGTDKTPEPEPFNAQQQDTTSILESNTRKENSNQDSGPHDDADNDADMEIDDHAGETGDTIVTTGLGSAGWSLYEGDTQMLPTGPSQIMHSSSQHQNSAVDIQNCNQMKGMEGVVNDLERSTESLNDGKEHVNEIEVPIGTGEKDLGKESDREPRRNAADDDVYNKETQALLNKEDDLEANEMTSEKVNTSGNGEHITDERMADDGHNLNVLEKLTPQNGSLPFSYPNDHLDNNVSPQEEKAYHEKVEEEDGHETQASQDLLAASPAKSKSDNLPVNPSDPAKTLAKSNVGDPKAQISGAAQAVSSPMKPSLASEGHDPSLQKKSDDLKEASVNGNVSSTDSKMSKVDQSSPKTTPQQKNNIIEETEWMASARHSHGKHHSNENSNSSSPRLLMPSFRPIRNDLEDERPAPKKPSSTLNRAPDDVSDKEDESWSGNGHDYNDSDSIENTQDEHDVQRPSAFKRLSRGTSHSKFSPQSSDRGEAKLSNDGSSRTKRAIKPKVLRYDPVTKSNDGSSSTSAASNSSSEAEFSDNDDDNVMNAVNQYQSQTDEQFMEQLREVKAMTLPTAQEIQDIASRKELVDEIAELKRMHKATVNKLKRENRKLVTQLKIAKDTIKERDQTISAKYEMLKKQSEVIKTLKDSLDAFGNRTSPATTSASKKGKNTKKPPPESDDSDIEEEVHERPGRTQAKASLSKKRLPSTKTKNNKRKKTTEKPRNESGVSSDEEDDEEHVRTFRKSSSSSRKHTPSKTTANKKSKKPETDSDNSDSDEEDDKMPLSALKSDNRKRRKSYGSRQAKAMAKKVERGAFPPKGAAARNHLVGDSSSVETSPVSNQSSSVSNSKCSDVLSPELWKKLKEKGWKYQTGPEPHNKVYVPKDGATHPGTKLGIHFFTCDTVVAAAIERGDLDGDRDNDDTLGKKQAARFGEENGLRTNIPSNNSTQYLRHKHPESDSPADDSRLLGKLKILTLESAQSVIKTVASFMREDDGHEWFNRLFFTPMWDRLKGQGGVNSGLGWRYDPLRNPLSSKSWSFVPPNSTLGSKGEVGRDYFVTEEQVALFVLKEVSTVKEVSQFYNDHRKLFSVLVPLLTRAVDENMEYKDVKLGKSASVRTRRAKLTYQPGQDQSSRSSPKSGASKRKSPQKKGQQSSSSKRGISKITPESKGVSSTAKKQKTSKQTVEHTSPSFHMSQTQSIGAILPSYNRHSPGQNNGPLSNFSFFYSGIDPSFKIDEKIKRLGGKIVDYKTLTVSNSRRKVFFLADYTSWRKIKYIYAASLGAPMLYYQWISELEQKHQDRGVKAFDSELFIKYRLPLGLDLKKGCFPLQRASNARIWAPPGMTKTNDHTIFDGLTIALAIEQGQEADWKMILTACGATVKTPSEIRGKGKITVDCCLMASTSLPPHAVSVPVHVSNLMKFIGDDVPLLDLAWAHQSIIQRECLPLKGDPRYSVSLEYERKSTFNVFSIKSSTRSKNDIIRYEVGDLVEFRRGPNSNSQGRIVGITWERQGKCKLEVQLLDLHEGSNLVDCLSSAKIVIDESDLVGNVLMMGSSDFGKLGYTNSGRNRIFNRYVPSNESQM